MTHPFMVLARVGAHRRHPSPRRAGLTLLAAVLAVAGTLVTAGALANSPAGAATAPTVTVQHAYQPAPSVLTAVSCAKPTDCVAGGQGGSGAAIVTTTDGGSTWTSVAVPDDTEGLRINGVSCAATTAHCVAVGSHSGGSVVLVSSDGGTAWAAGTVPSGVTDLYGVSCTSSLDCVAVGQGAGLEGAVITTTDGGATWTSHTLTGNSTSLGLNAVSCVGSVTQCVAVGSGSGFAVVATPSGGGTWSATAPPSGVTGLNGVSCTTSSHCVAVGQGSGDEAAIITTTDGTTWSSETVPNNVTGLGLNGVSCAATGCIAAGTASGESVVLGSTGPGQGWFGGISGTWSGDHLLDGVSCVAKFCAVVGQRTGGTVTVEVSKNHATTWTDQTAAVASSGVDDLTADSCPTATDCAVTGTEQFLSTTTGGSTWAAVPSSQSTPRSLSCPSASACYDITSTTPQLHETTTDGSTWTTTNIVGASVADAISCPAAGTCYAAGGSQPAGTPAIFFTDTSGSSWATRSLPAGVGAVGPLSCPSSSTCYVVATPSGGGGDEILSTTDSGQHWAVQALPSNGARTPTASYLSCSSTSTCSAVSYLYDQYFTTTGGGAHWTTRGPSDWPAGHYFLGLGCSSTTDCVAVGDSGSPGSTQGAVTTTDNGGSTWTSASLSGARDVSGVSCVPTTTVCEAVGTDNAGGGLTLKIRFGSVPATPTGVTATAGVSSATVHWSEPSTGAMPSSFVVRATPGTRS
ncbi:MAG: WD40/YVTN/BNR-like repeat-containing protein, partial [Acidimicrobiales bacterium]